MKKLLLATGNKGKLEEAQEILKIPLEIVDIELEEIQSMDLEYVARKKAIEAYKKLKRPLVVDDVSVEIEVWNGFPGPLVKFLFLHLGNKKVIELLKSEKNRNVIVKSAVAYHDGKKIHTFIGEVKGTIAERERGTEGWGFDPIIIPNGYSKTYAEMGLKGKSVLSHRRRAFDKLKKFLDSQANKNAI